MACVLAVLLGFIRQLLDSDSDDGDGAGRQALSIAQDVVFYASKGRKSEELRNMYGWRTLYTRRHDPNDSCKCSSTQGIA